MSPTGAEAFSDLTPRQRDALVAIIDAAATDRYDPEMMWADTFGGAELTLSGMDGTASKDFTGVTKSGLRAFADGGYATLEHIRSGGMTVALKQHLLLADPLQVGA